MGKKIITVVFSLLLLVNTCGCIAIVAGAAAGAGTAVWISGKLSQEVNATFEKTLIATKSALKSLNLYINKETVTDQVAQLKSTYTDGKTIIIDVERVSALVSRLEVRVGVPVGDKEAAHIIINKILKYL